MQCRMFHTFKIKQEDELINNFEYSIKEISGVDNHSFIQHTWITNMTQKFYLHHSSNAIYLMYKEIGLCNAICDSQRQYEGFDDEYEDEDKQLI